MIDGNWRCNPIFNQLKISPELCEEWALATSLRDLGDLPDTIEDADCTTFAVKQLGETIVTTANSTQATSEAVKSVITAAKGSLTDCASDFEYFKFNSLSLSLQPRATNWRVSTWPCPPKASKSLTGPQARRWIKSPSTGYPIALRMPRTTTSLPSSAVPLEQPSPPVVAKNKVTRRPSIAIRSRPLQPPMGPSRVTSSCARNGKWPRTSR